MELHPANAEQPVKRSVHRLPCTIQKDGEAPTARAFCPFPDPIPSFRGHQLRQGNLNIHENSQRASHFLHFAERMSVSLYLTSFVLIIIAKPQSSLSKPKVATNLKHPLHLSKSSIRWNRMVYFINTTTIPTPTAQFQTLWRGYLSLIPCINLLLFPNKTKLYQNSDRQKYD